MNRNPHQLSAFSLVETLLSAAVAAIILTVVMMYFLSLMEGRRDFAVNQELHYNLQFAIQTLTREIKLASAVNEGSSTLDIHPGVLSLAENVPGDDPTVFSVNNGVLQLQKGSQTPLSVTSQHVEVTQLVFSYQEPLNSTGNVTGTLRLSSSVDATQYLTEDFMIGLRVKN